MVGAEAHETPMGVRGGDGIFFVWCWEMPVGWVAPSLINGCARSGRMTRNAGDRDSRSLGGLLNLRMNLRTYVSAFN